MAVISGNEAKFEALPEYQNVGHVVSFVVPHVMVMAATEAGLRHAAVAVADENGVVQLLTPMFDQQ